MNRTASLECLEARPALPRTGDSQEARKRWLFLGLLLAAAAALVAALSVGRYPIPLSEVAKSLFGVATADDAISLVIRRVRLPRALSALLIGAALSSAGSAYQGVFRNPMASPDILGASAGAAFGAALGLLKGWNILEIQICAFCMGLLAVGITCFIGWRAGRHSDPVLSLILAGVLVGSLFTALLSLIKYVADPYNTLPAITFWLLGSLASIHTDDLTFLTLPMFIGLTPLLLLRWRLNVLSLGDDEARALGVNTGRLRLAAVLCATLMTTSSVAIAGLIGWVGLVVPHVARTAIGPDYRYLLPVSAVLGGMFLVLADCAARTVLAVEIPLGLLSSLIGLPFFLFMLNNTKRGWR